MPAPPQVHRETAWQLTGLVCALALLLLLPGCVRRRLTVRSNPPGATVYVDDQEIGQTPVSSSFTYYGTRKVQLVREGHDTVTVKEKIEAPWYQYVPFDFVAENLWPYEIRDERVLDFELVPQQNIDPNTVVERGQTLRTQAAQGTAIPTLGGDPAPVAAPAVPPINR